MQWQPSGGNLYYPYVDTNMKVVLIDSYVNRDDAEEAREKFLGLYEKDITDGRFYIKEDSINLLNGGYSVRVMLAGPQGEFIFG